MLNRFLICGLLLSAALLGGCGQDSDYNSGGRSILPSPSDKNAALYMQLIFILRRKLWTLLIKKWVR